MLKAIVIMERGQVFGKKVLNMLVNGKCKICMVLALVPGQMEIDMKVIG